MKSILLSIAKGAAIAGVGAALTYAVSALGSVDFGIYSPVVSAALAVVVNAAHKLTPATPASDPVSAGPPIK